MSVKTYGESHAWMFLIIHERTLYQKEKQNSIKI